MGDEFGQGREWNHDSSLDWDLLKFPYHSGLQRWVTDLNALYQAEPALYEVDFEAMGFEWIDCNDNRRSVISFLRWPRNRDRPLVVVCNFTPVPQHNYSLGVPFGGYWIEALNSDATLYGGSGQGNFGGVEAVEIPAHGRPCSITITLPPLSTVMFRRRVGK
jgi:1,4-alpha-glucan branching enzyme